LEGKGKHKMVEKLSLLRWPVAYGYIGCSAMDILGTKFLV